MPLYPLKFQPDLLPDVSVIANGPLAGQTLRRVMEQFGADLFGDAALIGPEKLFPVAVKWIDARVDSPIQVYGEPACWYVVEVAANARAWKGIRPGTTAEDWKAAVGARRAFDCLNEMPLKPGQAVFLPAGVPHALGAGVLAIHVCTSDKPLPPIEQAIELIDFAHTPEPRQKRSHVAGFFTTVSRLIVCPAFTLEKVRFIEGVEEAIPYDQPVVWVMLAGHAQLRVDDLPEPVEANQGDTLLLPARMNNPRIKTLGDCVWLELTFPPRGLA